MEARNLMQRLPHGGVAFCVMPWLLAAVAHSAVPTEIPANPAWKRFHSESYPGNVNKFGQRGLPWISFDEVDMAHITRGGNRVVLWTRHVINTSDGSDPTGQTPLVMRDITKAEMDCIHHTKTVLYGFHWTESVYLSEARPWDGVPTKPEPIKQDDSDLERIACGS